MMLIDLDVPTNPETGNTKSWVLALFLNPFWVRVRIHFSSPRSVLSPEGTERDCPAVLATGETALNSFLSDRVFGLGLARHAVQETRDAIGRAKTSFVQLDLMRRD